MRGKLLDFGLFVCSALFTGLLFYSLTIVSPSSDDSPSFQSEQNHSQSDSY